MSQGLNSSIERLNYTPPFKSYQARSVIDYVAPRKNVSMKELSKQDTSSNLKDVLEDLEDKGFVKLESEGEKITSVEITEKGLGVYSKSQEIQPKIEDLIKTMES